MKFFTTEQLVSMIETLKLQTTIAKTQTFDAIAGDLPLAAIERCLRYGFQRHFNDGVASIEDKKVKCDTVSLELGEMLAGTWSAGKARVAAVPTETNVRRKVVLAALSKEDKKKLAKLSDEERAKRLDDCFDNNEKVLMPVFEEEMRRLNAKMKVSVSI